MSPKRPAQLRNAIDHGRTRDKVAASDPAAAPLGTDEEAAGTPVPPDAVETALRHETSRSARDPDSTDAEPLSFTPTAAVLVVMVIVVALVIGALIIQR
jgi:hypothetical protein